MSSTIEAFRENGSSGHTYRLIRHGEESVGMEDLNNVRFYAISRGHIALDGAIETNADSGEKGEFGLLKIKPELTDAEIRELQDAGFSAESHPTI